MREGAFSFLCNGLEAVTSVCPERDTELEALAFDSAA